METWTLDDQVFAALRRITRAIDVYSRALLEQHGLTAPQLAALQVVGRTQPVPVGEVARSIHLSQATVTGILSRLQQRGLVSRTRDGKDRRSVVAQLTPEGEHVLRSAPSLLQEGFRRELSNLRQWEQTQILATLQRIAGMMDSEGVDAAPPLSRDAAAAAPQDVSRHLEEAALHAEDSVFGAPPAADSQEPFQKEDGS
jgi:DNA-binding MarR family transcriptional regulator